jgi:hypothetical protein
MENNRGERGNKHNPQEYSSNTRNGKTAPTGFEGMNYEQQRGSYRSSEIEEHSHKMNGRNRLKKNRGDI